MIDMSKIADMLGVRLGETFAISESDEEYILDEKGVRTVGSNTPYMPMTLGLLLHGTLKIKKKPWKPLNNETVWGCDRFGNPYSVHFRCDSEWDLLYFRHSLYFPSEKDAIAHKDEVMKKYQELKRYYKEV